MQDEIDILKRMLERERAARKEAEKILEEKSLSLYLTNERLSEINRNLEREVVRRTNEFQSFSRIPLENPEPVLRISYIGQILFSNVACQKLLNDPIIYNKNTYSLNQFCDYIAHLLIESQDRVELEVVCGASYYSFYCVPLHSESYINIYGRDITHSKHAERELKTTASRLTTLIANLHRGILVEDQYRKIVFTNKLFCEYFGINAPPEALIGFDCSDSAEQSKHLFKNPDFFVERIRTILTERKLVLYEQMELADGRIFERDYIPIFENGEYLGHLWKYEDITEKKNLQFALERREEKYRSIIENMNLGLIEVDKEEIIMYANQSFCETTGYSLDELLGKSAPEIFLRGMSKEMVEVIQKRREEGITDVYELMIKNARGEPVWMLISGGPLYNDNKKQIGSIGIHLDITERKKMESDLRNAIQKAEESTHAKELFLANMSHEIRTPMNAILGMSRLLQKTQLDIQQKSFLKAITTSGENLLVIINDILDFSKIEAGKLQVEKVALDIREVLQQVREVLAFKAEENGLQMLLRIDSKISAVLRGDPYRINQVLLNLAGNAVKFTPSGYVEISATVKFETPTFQVVEFKVKDTGIGIDSNKLENIFKSFTQEDNSITRKYGGTGLGLSICKSLVELMGGTIEVESEKNRGTTMMFTLGFEIGSNDEIPKKEECEKLENVLKGSDVLIVEDNEFNRFLASTILENKEANISVAVNGKDAIKKIKTQTFDLILMDIQMPEMNGWEATQYIRQEMNITTPIIALTANAIKGEKEKCLNLGMNDYLSKPFEEEELIESCSNWILKGNKTEKNSKNSSSDITTLQPEYPNEKLFDLFKLEQVSKGNEAFVNKMVLMFIEQAEDAIQKFGEYAESQDYTKIKSLAHKLKPSFDNMGINILKHEIREIEQIDAIQPDLERLTYLLNVVENILRKVISQLQEN
jgi:PAS domain S-box-containing protein